MLAAGLGSAGQLLYEDLVTWVFVCVFFNFLDRSEIDAHTLAKDKSIRNNRNQ